MNLSEPFVRRPVMTVVLTVSAILFGVLAYFTLPVNDLPAVDYPVIQVSVNYPGATPETMANNVATPLERQFMQIPGLELVTSNSGTGHTSFVLQFELSKSLDAAATDVQAAINQATAKLPVDLPSSADLHQDESERPADYLRRADQRHASPRASSTTTPIRRSASASAFCRASARWRCSARSPPCASRPILRPWPPRNITIDDLTAAIKNGTSYTGAGQFDGEHQDLPAAAARAVERGRGLRTAHRRPEQRRAGLPEGHRQSQTTACRTSA